MSKLLPLLIPFDFCCFTSALIQHQMNCLRFSCLTPISTERTNQRRNLFNESLVQSCGCQLPKPQLVNCSPGILQNTRRYSKAELNITECHLPYEIKCIIKKHGRLQFLIPSHLRYLFVNLNNVYPNYTHTLSLSYQLQPLLNWVCLTLASSKC